MIFSDNINIRTAKKLESLSIVILNWNGKHFLEKFLPSVMKFSGNANVIVADNASTDSSVDFLKENFPQISVIQLEVNEGFAKGYNEALKAVKSDFYLLLNSDIEVTENWLLPLLEVMEDSSVAGCQPKILAYDHRERFEHAGAAGGFLDKNYFPFCRGRIFDQFEMDQGQYDGTLEVFWATGAALLIRSGIFHKVGGFDPAFFAHMEEIDLCWRIKKKGYKFLAVPQSVIYHVGGGSLPYFSPKKTYLNFRNSLYVLVKNHEGFLMPKLIWRMILDGLAGLRFLVRGEWKQFQSVLRAHMDFYKRLRILLNQRKEIKQEGGKFNAAGLYRGNILWARYFKGVSKFSHLNQRLFSK
jgi:GT2 family glycosyltransferase